MDTLIQDVRYGLRMLRHSPGFTAIAVLSLALGIGANTAIFSLIDQVVLRWLPVEHPEQLVVINHDFLIPDYEKLAARSQSFSGTFAVDEGPMSASIDGQSQNVTGKFVSGTYHSVMGIHALLGRVITAEDDRPGRPLVCVLSYNYWKRRFGLSPGVLGKTITVKNLPFTIVGVAPEFGSGEGPDILVPMATHADLAMKDNDTVNIIGRLKPEITEKQANAELTLIYQQILTESAGSSLAAGEQRRILETKTEVRPAGHGGFHQFSMQLRIMAAVVGLVLLIACANIANLLLARATVRQREIAVRLAIGAPRGRLIRQLLTESLILALLAGCAGLVLALWGGHFLQALISQHTSAISPDARVLSFTLALSMLTGIIFGMVPALRATRLNLTPALKQSSLGSTGSAALAGSRRRLGEGLVVSQISFSLILLIGAALFLRTLQNLNNVDVGFEREHVLVMWALPTMIGYDIQKENNVYWRLLQKLEAIHGVQSASLSRLQLFSGYWVRPVSVSGYAPGVKEDMRVSCNTVAPKFFATMGIPLLLGRDFTPSDNTKSAKVVIISETMARQYFHGQNPIGMHFRFTGAGDTGDVEIVGVAKDILNELRQEAYNRSPRAAYIPFTQAPSSMTGQAVIEVRTAAKPGDIATAMHNAALAVDANLPLGGVQTQEEVVSRSFSGKRSLAELTTFFGLLALLLASIGLYGTMSYSVGQRTREIGIRMALGAQGHNVLGMVLREGMRLVIIGIAVGLASGVAVTRLISSQLYNLSPADPITFAAVPLFLVAVALLASCIPARCAMKIDPMVALRYE